MIKHPVASVHDENRAKKKWRFFSDDFAQVKEPRQPKNKIAKKRYTSIVARIQEQGCGRGVPFFSNTTPRFRSFKTCPS